MTNDISRRSLIVASAAGALGLASGHTEGAGAQTQAPYVGCAASLAGSYDPQVEWDKAQDQIGGGKLTYRRSFDSTIPAAGAEAWRKADAPGQFYSIKPPNGDVQEVIDGAYDSRLRTLIAALPNGTKFTMYHEPEDNLSGSTFAKLFTKVHGLVKERQYVSIWYVAMAYQWETNSKGQVGTNAGWIDAARLADGVGLDVYAPDWDFVSIEGDKGYQRWKREIVEESGTPWGIIERGIDSANGQAARLAMLKDDWAFTRANGSKFFLYWQSTHGGDWRVTGSDEQAYFRTMAAEGRPLGSS